MSFDLDKTASSPILFVVIESKFVYAEVLQWILSTKSTLVKLLISTNLQTIEKGAYELLRRQSHSQFVSYPLLYGDILLVEMERYTGQYTQHRFL